MNIWNALFRNRLKCTARAFCRIAHWFLQIVLQTFGIGGRFHVECVAPDGTVRWRSWLKNGVTGPGLDDLNNTYFRNGTTKTAWYIGLIDNTSYSALASGDIMTSHAGWIENVSYTNTARPAWGPGVSSGQSLVNGTTANFSMSAVASIRGLFLVSDSTLNGTAGLLWATAAFSGGVQPCNPGDTLKVTYTVSGISGS